MALVIATAALTPKSALGAQQADVIRGRVSASGTDEPLNGATVIATTLSGGVNRTGRTDRNGRYTITFPGGEGDYFITVRAIGYVPRRFELKRTADEDILIGDVRLTLSSSTLDTMVTLGKRDRPQRTDSASDISGLDRVVNTSNVAIENLGNLTVMAATTPGLLFIPGVDGDPSGYSALGLDPTQNSLSLNGMNSVATDLPRDGDFTVSVALSPYDVSQGQFSGGHTNVRISSGSNFIRRTGSLLLNTPPLEWTDRVGHSLGQEYTNANLGGGMSGPIRFDEAFYNFSYQLGRSSNDLHTLLNTDPLGLRTVGISTDSVARLVGILGNARVPATVDRFPSSRLGDQGVVLGSFDFTPPTSNSGQAFNVTMNGAWNRMSPAQLSTTGVPSSAFDNTSWNSGVQAHHSAYYGFVLSESGLSASAARRFSTPYLDLPSGRVLVASTFDDGTGGVTPVLFGGASTEFRSTTTVLEATNQLSWFSEDNKHRVKLTTDLRRDGYDADQGSNTLGTFTFNSLADLAAGRDASFTRQLSTISSHEGEWLGSVALGDAYRPTHDLQITYGARLDMNHFVDSPAANADVSRLFNISNTALPSRAVVSPRLGFAWTYGTTPEIAAFSGAARAPRAVVRGGIGVFQGTPNPSLVSQPLVTNGLATGVQQVSCTGAAAPVPNWSAFANTANIPSACADGTTGTAFASSAPNVTLFSPNYAAPRSVRSNLQWSGAVLDNRALLTIGGIYSINQQLPGFVDLNLQPTSRFTLADEARRPVFVDPSSIVPGTGAIALRDGRVAAQFNHVTELRSELSSTTRQLQFSLVPVGANTHYTWGITYTLNSVRERTNGFSSTVGDPFAIATGRASFDWRHQLQGNVGYNLFDVIRLNWFQTFLSRLPYTPVVAGDVNGDGYASNDRAFVFDPAHASDPAVGEAMSSLLANSSPGARSCLTRQLGALAARNSCEAPWTSTATLRVDFNPIAVRMPERTMLSFSISNPLAGADLLLHGQNHIHGWGQFVLPDNQLLYVRGFDPQARRFTYQVNPRFGNTSPAASALRSPVAITALVRVDLGPTRERQALTRTLDQGRTTAGPKATAAELRAMYGMGGLINPMATILRSADTLKLTGPQADSIATLNRWYLVRLDSIWGPVVRTYASLPERYSQHDAYVRYVHAREASVDLLIKLAPMLSGVLTPAQRRKLPPLTASHLDKRFLLAVRSGTPNLSAPVFPPPAGVAAERGGGRGGGGR
ncbi:MAG TPA: carboxypeptidase regulatory-like domain-containing protein [Gemmatimonadaceae bacterium]|nr:carboxypeptidase regulatory-like domain-containing protein [Gemmatimonadaceae bacterium]